MDGVFWDGDVGFVVDQQRLPSSFADGISIPTFSLDQLLIDCGRLPLLGPAPVASWLLARLMQLTTEGLGFGAYEKVYNDGGGYSINFVAFSRDMQPLAFFNVLGSSSSCRCWGQASSPFPPEILIQTFIHALTSDVTDLMECKVTCFDTDPPNLPKRRIGKPHVFGWDGSRFLGFQTKPE